MEGCTEMVSNSISTFWPPDVSKSEKESQTLYVEVFALRKYLLVTQLTLNY
jgi:hypothetical protein